MLIYRWFNSELVCEYIDKLALYERPGSTLMEWIEEPFDEGKLNEYMM